MSEPVDADGDVIMTNDSKGKTRTATTATTETTTRKEVKRKRLVQTQIDWKRKEEKKACSCRRPQKKQRNVSLPPRIEQRPLSGFDPRGLICGPKYCLLGRNSPEFKLMAWWHRYYSRYVIIELYGRFYKTGLPPFQITPETIRLENLWRDPGRVVIRGADDDLCPIDGKTMAVAALEAQGIISDMQTDTDAWFTVMNTSRDVFRTLVCGDMFNPPSLILHLSQVRCNPLRPNCHCRGIVPIRKDDQDWFKFGEYVTFDDIAERVHSAMESVAARIVPMPLVLIIVREFCVAPGNLKPLPHLPGCRSPAHTVTPREWLEEAERSVTADCETDIDSEFESSDGSGDEVPE